MITGVILLIIIRSQLSLCLCGQGKAYDIDTNNYMMLIGNIMFKCDFK